MEVLATLSCPHLAYSSRPTRRSWNTVDGNPRFRVLCLQFQNQNGETNSVYKPGFVDDLLLNFFRKKMVEEVGWDSEKLGYDGLVEVVNRLVMKGRSNLETEQSAVRILKSLFPPLLLVLFKMHIVPLGGGKLASMMVARVTAWSCQWLMGASSVNSIDLPDGSSCSSGVFVERCKYLAESKCVGICINTCKLPTQTFFKDYMGIPLYMEPKFSDYSCQSKFLGPVTTKKVDALEERLKDEVGQLKSEFEDQFFSIEGRFSSIEGRFFNLGELMMQVLDFHTKPASLETKVLAVAKANGGKP